MELSIHMDAVKFAKEKYKLNLKTGDLLNLKINENDKYDYIVLNNVLEHIYNPLKTLKKTNKMLESNGRLLLQFQMLKVWVLEYLKETGILCSLLFI